MLSETYTPYISNEPLSLKIQGNKHDTLTDFRTCLFKVEEFSVEDFVKDGKMYFPGCSMPKPLNYFRTTVILNKQIMLCYSKFEKKV